MTGASPEVTGSRRGRRGGHSDTRGDILLAARTAFSRNGFEATTIRSIAETAQVDTAMVHHWFGTKRELFLAAVQAPADPDVLLAPVRECGDERVGATLVSVVIGLWDGDFRSQGLALLRSAFAGSDAELLRTLLMRFVLRDLSVRFDHPTGSGTRRTALVASQMVGVVVARYVLQIEPMATMGIDDLVETIGPVLQRYLTDPV